MSEFKRFIKTIPDFPVKGIEYRDIQPLLADERAFEDAINAMTDMIKVPYEDIDYVVGIESRGFIFATALAWFINRPLKLIRKKGKLPNKNTVIIDYDYEYSSGAIEMQIGEGKVILVDDVFATGGTMQAAEELAKEACYDVIDKFCFIDIGILKDHDVKCVVTYE